MGNRYYSLLIANPASPNVAQIEHLIDDEHATLTLVRELISYTSVTEPSPWPLVGSAVKLTKQGKNYKDEWAASAYRGTAAHDICQDLALFGKPEDQDVWLALQPEKMFAIINRERVADGKSPLDELTDKMKGELKGYATAALSFFLITKPKVLSTEFVVADLEAGVAGRADLYAAVDGGKQHVLIDYKSVDSDEKIARFPRAYLDNCREVVARAFAMRKVGKRVDACWVVRLSPSGAYHIRPILKEEEQGLFDSFLRARWEWEFRNAEGWS